MGKRKLSKPNPDVISLETPSYDQTLDKVNIFNLLRDLCFSAAEKLMYNLSLSLILNLD